MFEGDKVIPNRKGRHMGRQAHHLEQGRRRGLPLRKKGGAPAERDFAKLNKNKNGRGQAPPLRRIIRHPKSRCLPGPLTWQVGVCSVFTSGQGTRRQQIKKGGDKLHPYAVLCSRWMLSSSGHGRMITSARSRNFFSYSSSVIIFISHTRPPSFP